MLLLSAQPILETLYQNFKPRIQTFTSLRNRKPTLAIIQIGKNPASCIYIQKKIQVSKTLGMHSELFSFSETTPASVISKHIHALNQNPLIDGIILQRPLPSHFLESEVVFWIHPDKDVDALHPLHAGRTCLNLNGFVPCTPAGILLLLTHYRIPLKGKTVCILGRSAIVGKPMAHLLLNADMTVLQCHRQTQNLSQWTKQADLLIVAIGKKQWIDASFVRSGSVVIDVGIHHDPQNAHQKIVGDVHENVRTVASALTPVPGGVGPLTIAMLIQNTLHAAEQSKL